MKKIMSFSVGKATFACVLDVIVPAFHANSGEPGRSSTARLEKHKKWIRRRSNPSQVL